MSAKFNTRRKMCAARIIILNANFFILKNIKYDFDHEIPKTAKMKAFFPWAPAVDG
jgi:hypothetical protein